MIHSMHKVNIMNKTLLITYIPRHDSNTDKLVQAYLQNNQNKFEIIILIFLKTQLQGFIQYQAYPGG